MKPEEDREYDERVGAPLLGRQAERVGVLQPREDSRQTLLVVFQHLKGSYKKAGEKRFTRVGSDRSKVMTLN